MTALSAKEAADWSGPGARGRLPGKFQWSRLLWSLIWPRGGERVVPTVSGMILIGLSLGLGAAAYNSSSNILFITLSLLLSALILSGVLSWLNLRGVAWRLDISPPWRAGQMAGVGLVLRNGKKFVPTYGLSFEFTARAVAPSGPARAEATITAKGIGRRAALKKADGADARGILAFEGRLDPRGEERMEWCFVPAKRGRLRVESGSVESLFPFGFLKKKVGAELRRDVLVWPAPVAYRSFTGGMARRVGESEQLTRVGLGGDLMALRRYASGDSHRLIHWKVSARTGHLHVREFTAESSAGLALWLCTTESEWTRAEQFEQLVGFVATLVEDLFWAGRLRSVAIDADPPLAVRHVRDLEAFLDRLAVLEVLNVDGVPAPRDAAKAGEGARAPRGKNLLTFAPDGVHGVAAYIDGNKAASA